MTKLGLLAVMIALASMMGLGPMGELRALALPLMGLGLVCTLFPWRFLAPAQGPRQSAWY